jgi:general secretion pathway protein G
MKNQKLKSAFTMIELVFVIVIIGILAAVAVPRLAATRDDAQITKAKVLVASVRNALAMERQKRILRGEFGIITALTNDSNVFGTFKAKNSSGAEVDTGHNVLEYDMSSSTEKGKWEYKSLTKQYIYHGLSDVAFVVDTKGKFVCVDKSADNCKQLTN